MTYEYKSIYFDDPIRPGRVMDILEPSEVTRDVAIFFSHGGGWSGGARGNYHQIIRAFNREGFVCASTDYRLIPSGVTILDQVEDIRIGYKLFLKHLADHDRPLKVFTHGSSAGAHLTALLSLTAPGECGENADAFPEIKWVPPIGTSVQATPVTFEPWEDIFPQIWTCMQNSAGKPYGEDTVDLYKKLSPREHISSKSCPVFFLEAANEHMFPLELVDDTVERLKKLNVRVERKIYTNAEHGFFYDVTRRQQKEAFADILKFIESL